MSGGRLRARYSVTERLDPANPHRDDPLAQLMQRYTGIYDLRDTHHPHLRVVSEHRDIKLARSAQAVLNTRDTMDIALGY